ncbi:hypothetical protein POM88_033097 [Heracleum sosnowskyi]|uniref:Uncharacterized protein n=1 Tax=Heracleum sosnowskyi TaxID=360622 RepID=A0AAD8I1V1_9APIA|nr:hypothetical protein POM88_033097 [Heracleum sosnowskyi]
MADDLDTAREICSAKGEWVLRLEDYGRTELLPFVVDVEYDESLLLWHIATDLCYHEKVEPLNNDYRKIAKLISDCKLPGRLSSRSAFYYSTPSTIFQLDDSC